MTILKLFLLRRTSAFKTILFFFSLSLASLLLTSKAAAELRDLNTISIAKTENAGEFIYFNFSRAIDTNEVLIDHVVANEVSLIFRSTRSKTKVPEFSNSKLIEQVSFEQEGDAARVRFLFKHPVGQKLSVTGKQVILTVSSQADAQAQIVPNHGGMFKHYLNRIVDVEFHKATKGGAELIISASTSNVRLDIDKAANQLKLRFENTQLSDAVEPYLNVHSLNTPIKSIKTQVNARTVTITLDARNDFRHLVRRYNNVIVLDIRPQPPETIAEFAQKATAYNGKPISFDFQNIGVRSLLQIIADFTGMNIVVTDSVNGDMSLKLKNIPWDQALDIILDSQNLTERRIGDIVFIAPSDELTNREIEHSLSQLSLSDSAPLYSEVFNLQYSKSKEIAKVIKDSEGTLLSSRGQVGMDERTNAIWVRDTAERLVEIRKVVKRIDVPTRQVSIEARVISIDSSMKDEIGVRLGITRPGNGSNLSGSLEGTDAIALGTPLPLIPLGNRLNYDFAARAIDGLTPSSIALGLLKIGDQRLLDLELSALEREGITEVISRPHLITTNMHLARVEKGEEIPFEEKTNSGATSVKFKKAVLSLEVTPQITPDQRIILDIKVNEDKVGERVFKGLPTIDTQNINTQVLLNDGETVVLGGIYKTTEANKHDGIPYLRNIPYLGALFGHKSDSLEKKELLIFVTPKLITHASYL